MSVNAILAHDKNYGIGYKGDLPWPRNDADMKWFRDCTLGHAVLMGRNTWESIGSKPLPKRENIVISTKTVETAPITISGNMKEIIDYTQDLFPRLHLWIIGGANIYEQALPFCDHIYVTKFHDEYECDTFVQMDRYLKGYAEVAKKEKDGMTFSIWSRI